MPIIDPGITVVDDLGRPLLSKDAIHLPKPPDISSIGPDPNNRMPAVMQGANAVAPTPQSLGQTPETGPILNQRQGPGTLPQTSIPSEIYKMGASQMPNREELQPHGLHKVLDILAGISTLSPIKGIQTYEHLQNRPYNQAMQDWSTKLAAIKPEIEHEQFQAREKREGEQATAQLKSTDEARKSTEAHQRAIEEQTDRQRAETERRDAEQEAFKKQEEERRVKGQKLLDDIKKREEDRRKAEDDERDRHNRVMESIGEKRADKAADSESKGTWQPYEDPETGKLTKIYNPKTGEIKDAPKEMSQIQKPGTYAKQQEKEKPFKYAEAYADDYIKSGKFTGAGDYALVQALNAAVQSDRNRFQRYEFDKIVQARSLIEGMIARGEHLADGTYLGSKERQEFLDTIRRAAKARGIPDSNSTPKVNAPTGDVKINHRRPVEGN